MSVMEIEESIVDGLKRNFPGSATFYEPGKPMECLQRAASVEAVMMNINAREEDIYYAFLKDVLAGENYFNVSQEAEMLLDGKVATRMFQEHFDYMQILRCMTYSASLAESGTNMEKRWQKAVDSTALFLNPVLSVFEPTEKPLAGINIDKDAPEDIYAKCLHVVLRKQPSLLLYSADKEVVKILVSAGCNDHDRLYSIMGNSLNFVLASSSGNLLNDHEETVQRMQELNSFLSEALQDAAEKPWSYQQLPRSDEEIYNEMQAKIRSMKEEHEKGDKFSYWTTAIGIIKNTMDKLQSMQNLSKTLKIWAVGLERASEELAIQMESEYKEMPQKIKMLLEEGQQVEKNVDMWEAFWPVLARMEIYSKELLTEIKRKQEQNPLLKIPEVQHAAPFTQIAANEDIKHEALYYAALRDVVENNPGIGQASADNQVVNRLRENGRDEDDIAMALSYSPCLKNLTRVQALGAAQNMVDNCHSVRQGGDMVR